MISSSDLTIIVSAIFLLGAALFYGWDRMPLKLAVAAAVAWIALEVSASAVALWAFFSDGMY